MVVAAAASLSPAAGRPHPTYTKMITHALAELGGASPRPAIAGYILGSFSGLPASHDALLSAHLRRLVAEGVLRAHGSDSYIFDPPPAEEPVKRGPGRPRKSATPSLLPAKRKRAVLPGPGPGDDDDDDDAHEEAVPVTVKRGRGRPRKTPPASSHWPHTMNSLLPPTKDKPLQPGDDDDSVTKRGPAKPATHQATPIQARAEVNFQTVHSGAASSAGIKRGRGRPRKEKPPAAAAAEAAAMSPISGMVASLSGIKRGRGRPRKEKPSEPANSRTSWSVALARGFKKGCGRPSMGRPSSSSSAAMSPTSGMAASLSAIKRGRGRPRKEKPSEPANSRTSWSVALARGFKKGCGRPSMGRPSSSAAAAASCEYGVAASMGIKTGSGTPRMDNPAAATISAETSMEKLAAAAMYAESGHDASEGIQAGVRQSRIEKLAAAVAAMSAETIKRGRGRPKKEKPAAPAGAKRSRGRPRKDQCIDGLVEAACEVLLRDATEASTKREEEDLVSREKTKTEEGGTARSLETGDAASTGIKRARGRPRKNPAAAMSAEAGDAVSTRVKRGRGRPRKNQSIGTGCVEAAGAVLFRGMAEASSNQEEDLVSAEKTQNQGVAPGDREEADAGCVPVSGENAPFEAAGAIGSDLGSANLQFGGGDNGSTQTRRTWKA